MGVWIEIKWDAIENKTSKSLPVWECGLKLKQKAESYNEIAVTPCVGVWIEIPPR